jgi:hypothetical protein
MLAAALVLAASLAAPPAAAPAGETRPAAEKPHPLLGAPAGSGFSLEGRAGGATCGYCGLMLGGAVVWRDRAAFVGAFVEVAAPVGESGPRSAALAVGSYFFGAHAGVVGELPGGHRIGMAPEVGVQLASAHAVHPAGLTRSQAIPIVGGRATVDFRLDSGTLLGLAVFVRQPLTDPCMDVGLGCKKVATTYGLVIQGTLDLTEPEPARRKNGS